MDYDYTEGRPPWAWDAEQVAQRRRDLAEMVEHVPDDELGRVAEMSDILDILDGLNSGSLDADEGAAQMKGAHKKVMPDAAINWACLEPGYWGVGWSIHPADMTLERLGELSPLAPPLAEQVLSECEQVWVATTGEPGANAEPEEERQAVVFGATVNGAVAFQMVTAVDPGPDCEYMAVAQLGMHMPVQSAEILLASLTAAIERARTLRTVHIERGAKRLRRHLTSTHDMSEAEVDAVVVATIAAAEDGFPQAIIGPDGEIGMVSFGDDGDVRFIEADLDTTDTES